MLIFNDAKAISQNNFKDFHDWKNLKCKVKKLEFNFSKLTCRLVRLLTPSFSRHSFKSYISSSHDSNRIKFKYGEFINEIRAIYSISFVRERKKNYTKKAKQFQSNVISLRVMILCFFLFCFIVIFLINKYA